MTERRAAGPRSVAATVIVVLLTLAVWWLQQRGDDAPASPAASPPSSSSTPTTPSTPSTPSTPTTSRPTTSPPTTSSAPPSSATSSAAPRDDGLPVVALADLPLEAAETVDLIDAGGPYPYDEDDGTFGNYEGLLPDQPRGYYREYTVETPGAPTRGARRIIAGDDGTLYWTADHYESFAVIER